MRKRLTLDKMKPLQAQTRHARFRTSPPMKVAFDNADKYVSYIVHTKHGFVGRPGVIWQPTVTRNQSDAALYTLQGAKDMAKRFEGGQVYKMFASGKIAIHQAPKYNGDEYDYV